MKYLRLVAIGLTVYSEWLLPDGQIIRVDLDKPDYFDYIKDLREKYGDV